MTKTIITIIASYSPEERAEDCGPAAAMLIPSSFLISSVWDVLSCSKLMTGWQGLCQPTISISIPTKSMWNL